MAVGVSRGYRAPSRAGGSIAALILGALAALLPLPAATDGASLRAASFTGTCELSGALRQRPPLTNELAPGRARATAKGTCSGELIDRRGRTRRLDDAPVSYRARAAGELSCGGGTATGSGRLRFDRNETIRFAFSELRGPGVAAITLEGRAGGSAAGVANVSASEDPVETLERCSGSGLRRAQIELRLASLGISG